MADDTPWFHLGPLGRLYTLPSPAPGLDPTIEKVAARRRSLNARTTEDIAGFRRSWTLDLPYLDVTDLGWLEAAFTGVIGGPLRLVDPLRRNRLSLAASATDLRPDWTGGPDTARATSGAVISDYSTPWPTLDRDPLDGRSRTWGGDSVLKWTPTAAGTMTLDAPPYVPVLPGETVTASAYVNTTAGTVNLELVPRTPTGDTAPVVSTVSATGSWTMLTATLTPSAQTIAVYPRVRTTTGATVRIAAAQLETGPAATPWLPGSGCPEVLITDLPEKSPIYPLTSATLSLVEV